MKYVYFLLRFVFLLVGGVMLVACGSNSEGGETAEQSGSVAVQTFDEDSPEGVVNAYLDACLNNDPATALSLYTAELQSLYAADPCGGDAVVATAVRSAHYGTEVSGNTAYVEWEWAWTEPEKTSRFQYSLANSNEGWRIFDGEYTYQEEVTTTETIGMIPASVVIEQDADLLEGIAYLKQSGIDGSNVIVTAVRTINGQTVSEELISETITAEAQDVIIAVGTKPRVEVLAEARQFVEGYFATYQSGGFADLVPLILFDDIQGVSIQGANDIAQTEIVTVDVDEAISVNVYPVEEINDRLEGHRREPERQMSLPNTPYQEPIYLEIIVPVFVRYRLFGVEVTSEAEAVALYRPDQGWQMRYWGVLLVADEQETEIRDDYELQVKGVALMHNATVVVLDVRRPLPEEIDLMNVEVYSDIDPQRFAVDRLQFIEGSTLSYVITDPINRQAVTAVVAFRIRLDLFTAYDGEVAVPLR